MLCFGMPSPVLDSRIVRLSSLLREYELQKYALAGHNRLSEALTLAASILIDGSSGSLHETVRQILGAWFERVRNWCYLATCERKPTPEVMRLRYANVELFNDPVFGFPESFFDVAGVTEILTILRKPIETWTARERRYFDEFLERAKKLARNHKKSTEA